VQGPYSERRKARAVVLRVSGLSMASPDFAALRARLVFVAISNKKDLVLAEGAD
jgi:hypothetical protein